MYRFMQRAHPSVGVTIHHQQHVASVCIGLHRRDQATADSQLIQPGLRHLVSPGRCDDAVVGCGRTMPQATISPHESQAVSPPGLQALARLFMQGTEPLDRHHLP